MEIERRDFAFEDDNELVVESRADGRAAIVGYAAVYNRLSLDLGGFKEAPPRKSRGRFSDLPLESQEATLPGPSRIRHWLLSQLRRLVLALAARFLF